MPTFLAAAAVVVESDAMQHTQLPLEVREFFATGTRAQLRPNLTMSLALKQHKINYLFTTSSTNTCADLHEGS